MPVGVNAPIALVGAARAGARNQVHKVLSRYWRVVIALAKEIATLIPASSPISAPAIAQIARRADLKFHKKLAKYQKA